MFYGYRVHLILGAKSRCLWMLRSLQPAKVNIPKKIFLVASLAVDARTAKVIQCISVWLGLVVGNQDKREVT